jgi:hypothetical protein
MADPLVTVRKILDPAVYWRLRHLISERYAVELEVQQAQTKYQMANLRVQQAMQDAQLNVQVNYTFQDEGCVLVSREPPPEPVPEPVPVPASVKEPVDGTGSPAV